VIGNDARPASRHSGRLVTGCAGNIEAVMHRLLHRYRRFLASAVLGLWTFALFVGIANACGWDGVPAAPDPPTVMAHAVDDAVDHGMAPGCDEFCSNDVPVFSMLKLVQDEPAGQPLVLAAHYYLGVLPILAPVLRLARNAHPPLGVPFSLRTVRLTL
jgi:hypothetical protein